MTADRRRPPVDPELEDLPPCAVCGQPFEEHSQDGDPAFPCPYEHQPQPCYGYFAGGDPRRFHPDQEMSSPEEIARHKEACIQANKDEKSRNLECPSTWSAGVHMLRAPFGIGISTFPESTYKRPS